MKKIYIIIYLSLCTLLSFAQSQKLPFCIEPSLGMNYNLLNKNVYRALPNDISQQIGLGFKFGISRHIALGIEGQYRTFNLGDNIGETYAPILGNNPQVSQFGRSQNSNGLLNLSYYRLSKKQKTLFEIGLGGGVQQLTHQTTLLSFQNPSLLGAMDTAFYQAASKKISPIGQAFVGFTFFPVKFIGIRLGVKAQYAPNLSTVTYKSTENLDASNQGSFASLCETKTITQTVYNPISIIPEGGITIKLGGPKKPKEPKPVDHIPDNQPDKKPKTGCFTLQWQDKPKKDACVDDDDLNFVINASSGLSNVMKYEVYIAPINDLNNPQYLFDIPYPSTSFKINTNILEQKKKYIVIVKMIYSQDGSNCAQTSGPIERCNTPCLIPGTNPSNQVSPLEHHNKK